LIDQALLGAGIVQRIEACLAHEGVGDELHPALLDVDDAVTQGDLVAAALQAGALTARIFEHGQDRLVQLEIEVQHTRRRGLQTARREPRIDEPGDGDTSLVHDAQ
jgi:hypothetical protein